MNRCKNKTLIDWSSVVRSLAKVLRDPDDDLLMLYIWIFKKHLTRFLIKMTTPRFTLMPSLQNKEPCYRVVSIGCWYGQMTGRWSLIVIINVKYYMLVKTILLYCTIWMQMNWKVLGWKRTLEYWLIISWSETIQKSNKMVGITIIYQSRLGTSWYHFLKHW